MHRAKRAKNNALPPDLAQALAAHTASKVLAWSEACAAAQAAAAQRAISGCGAMRQHLTAHVLDAHMAGTGL